MKDSNSITLKKKHAVVVENHFRYSMYLVGYVMNVLSRVRSAINHFKYRCTFSTNYDIIDL